MNNDNTEVDSDLDPPTITIEIEPDHIRFLDDIILRMIAKDKDSVPSNLIVHIHQIRLRLDTEDLFPQVVDVDRRRSLEGDLAIALDRSRTSNDPTLRRYIPFFKAVDPLVQEAKRIIKEQNSGK